jgi:hypothetical protein
MVWGVSKKGGFIDFSHAMYGGHEGKKVEKGKD